MDHGTSTPVEADFVSVFVLVAGGVAAGAAIEGALEINGLDPSSDGP